MDLDILEIFAIIVPFESTFNTSKHMKKTNPILFLIEVLFALTTVFFFSCSEDDETATNNKVAFSIYIRSTKMESTILAPSVYGENIKTGLTSHYKEGASYGVIARQNGGYIDLGDFEMRIVSSSDDEGLLEVEVNADIDTNKPFDIYLMSGSCRWGSDGMFYREHLVRDKGFSTWVKFSRSSMPSRVLSNLAGTGEMLAVINTSDAPIKFKHKGFNVAERWYYTYGEVSVDSGKVDKYEDGDEVEGTEHNVPVFTGDNAVTIWSFYVPNGKKISNAQLIAEIDGKEVRSVNRLSSNVNIETNRSYVMFAVWDGEKLTLGDE